jgi:probable HAF family extracellular repeat protein
VPRFFRFLFAVVGLVPLVANGAIPRGWTVVDLGTLGGSGSYATAISNTGLVAGCSETVQGVVHAFIYDTGVMRDLGSGADGAGSSCALAVNNAGAVAGRSSTGELVVWDGSAVIRLGVQGDVGAIADNGIVVGSYRDGAARRAFSFANGRLTTLDASGNSHAARINVRQQIVGNANGRAVLYESGAARDLGTLGGNGSSAWGLNDVGLIVGMAANANGQLRPFLFDGAMKDLVNAPGYATAVAINNAGQVVGTAEGSFGFMLDGDEVIRLDTLAPVVEKGLRRLEPAGINDRGWIVGTARNAAGDMRAFLLIPRSAYSSSQTKAR